MVRTILVKPSTLDGRIPARHRYQYKPRRGGLKESDIPRQAPHLLQPRLVLSCALSLLLTLILLVK